MYNLLDRLDNWFNDLDNKNQDRAVLVVKILTWTILVPVLSLVSAIKTRKISHLPEIWKDFREGYKEADSILKESQKRNSKLVRALK